VLESNFQFDFLVLVVDVRGVVPFCLAGFVTFLRRFPIQLQKVFSRYFFDALFHRFGILLIGTARKKIHILKGSVPFFFKKKKLYLSGGGRAKEPAMQNRTTTADEQIHFMSPATGEEESGVRCYLHFILKLD